MPAAVKGLTVYKTLLALDLTLIVFFPNSVDFPVLFPGTGYFSCKEKVSF